MDNKREKKRFIQQEYERLRQAELDANAERFKRNDEIINAIHRVGRRAELCGIDKDGTLLIHKGFFESIIDVYRAMGWKE